MSVGFHYCRLWLALVFPWNTRISAIMLCKACMGKSVCCRGKSIMLSRLPATMFLPNRGPIPFLIRNQCAGSEGLRLVPRPSAGLPKLHLLLWSCQSGSRPQPGTPQPLFSWEQCPRHNTPLCSRRITQAGLSAWHDIIISIGLFFLPEDVSSVIF